MTRTKRISKKRFKKGIIFLLLFIFIGVMIYFFGFYHFVNIMEGEVFILKAYPKKSFTLENTFIDENNVDTLDLRYQLDLILVIADKYDLEYVPGTEGKIPIEMAKIAYDFLYSVNKFDNEYKITDSFGEIKRILEEKFNNIDKTIPNEDYIKNIANDFNKWLKNK